MCEDPNQLLHSVVMQGSHADKVQFEDEDDDDSDLDNPHSDMFMGYGSA